MMPKLSNSLGAWQSGAFKQVVKDEIEALKPSALPLAQNKYVDDNHLQVTVLNAVEDAQSIKVNVGVFYKEIRAGCNCGDDPVLAEGYCQMRVSIDKASAEAEFELVGD